MKIPFVPKNIIVQYTTKSCYIYSIFLCSLNEINQKNSEDYDYPIDKTEKLLHDVRYKIMEMIWNNYAGILDKYLDREEQKKLMEILMR